MNDPVTYKIIEQSTTIPFLLLLFLLLYFINFLIVAGNVLLYDSCKKLCQIFK